MISRRSVAVSWAEGALYMTVASTQPGRRQRASFDRILFRTGNFGFLPSVQVVINGTDLVRLWRRATGDSCVEPVLSEFIGPGLAWWSLGEGNATSGYRSNSPDSVSVPEGYVPLLNCSCGNWDNGAVARIVVDDERVIWTDFENLYRERVESLGPFTFRRKQYEYAVRNPRAGTWCQWPRGQP